MSAEAQGAGEAAAEEPGAGSGSGPGDDHALPPIPDALLAPLLDAAGEALRRLPPADLPPAARRLRSFDRRGLATPAARQQLRTLLEDDEAIAATAVTVFRARPEVGPLAAAWDEALAAGGDAPVNLVSEAAAVGRLPLLASVLVSGLPDGFEFGLGLVVALAAVGGRERDAADAVKAATAGQEAAEEARRRAEAARATAEAEMSRLDAALRAERQTRRERDQQATDAAAGSAAREAELEAALAGARQSAADAERRAAGAETRAADAERRAAGAESRAADAEQRVAEAEQRAADATASAVAADRRAASAEERAERVEATPAFSAPPGPRSQPGARGFPARSDDDRVVLEEIAAAAEDLAAGLRRLAVGPPAPPPPPSPPPPPPPRPPSAARRDTSPSRPRRPARRAPVHLPPGMLQDDPAALPAMVRTPGLAVIVDGYNVSMLAWPDVSPSEQRERLCDALAELQLRFRCEVTVVFDGAEVTGGRLLRRRGLRVVFSAAGQEADEVVVSEVVFRPAEVPVLVVSSDREVQAGAESEGATVIGADELLSLLRR